MDARRFSNFMKSLVIFLIASGLWCAGLRAAPPVYESFDYAVGADLKTGNGEAENGGIGFGGPWEFQPTSGAVDDRAVVQSGSLAYPGLATSGNSLLMKATTPGAANVQRPLDTALPNADGSVYWVSFLLRWDGVAPGVFSVLFTPLAPGSSGANGFAVRYNTTDTNFRVTRTGSSASGSPGLSGYHPTNGNTDLLVLRILNGTTDQVQLFINPSLGAEPATASATVNLLAGAASSTPIGWVAVSAADDADTTWSFDELRIGSSFAEATQVPEPSIRLLLVLGTMLTPLSRRTAGR